MRARAMRSGENHSKAPEENCSSEEAEAPEVALAPELASVVWKSGGTALRSSIVPAFWSAVASKNPANVKGWPLSRSSSPFARAESEFVTMGGR